MTPPTVGMNEVPYLGCLQLSWDIMGEAMHVVCLPGGLGELCTLGTQTCWGVRKISLLGLGPAEPWQNFLLPGGSRGPEGG